MISGKMQGAEDSPSIRKAGGFTGLQRPEGAAFRIRNEVAKKLHDFSATGKRSFTGVFRAKRGITRRFRGAEAVLFEEKIAGIDAVVKERVAKGYRNRVLDTKLRKARTRVEVRLLHRVKEAGVPCPYVLEAGEFHFAMSKVSGNMLARGGMDGERAREAGELLAKMHSVNIVHGDYTPANLMSRRGSAITVIDFGLGAFSHDEEDKATDIVTMRKAVGQKLAKKFVAGYLRAKGERRIVEHAKKIEMRARYMEREGAP